MASPQGYRIRSRFVQTFLAVAREHPRGAEVLRHLPADVAARIDAQVTVGLVPTDDFEALMRAIGAAGGDDLIIELAGINFMRSALLRAALDALARVFGLNPHRLFRQAPRGRSEIVVEGGTMTYEKTGASSCVLHLQGFPRGRAHETLVQLGGSLGGILTVS